MEILTTAEVLGKTLNINQTITPVEGNFITIKEIFSIEEKVFVAIFNQQIPFTITIKTTGDTIQTNRFIIPAEQFVLLYNNLL